MDIKSREERSKNMAAIRSKNTSPEVCFRKLLFAQGYRYRTNVSDIPGHPDLYLRKYNAAVFVNGCFWHRHEGCKFAYMPKSRVEFWQKKFEANKRRDLQVQQELKERGIRCLIVWECTIRQMKKKEEICRESLAQVEAFLKGEERYLEVSRANI